MLSLFLVRCTPLICYMEKTVPGTSRPPTRSSQGPGPLVLQIKALPFSEKFYEEYSSHRKSLGVSEYSFPSVSLTYPRMAYVDIDWGTGPKITTT